MASRSNGRSTKKKAETMEVIKDAAKQLVMLTGKRPEKVLGLDHGEDGNWKVAFELVEMQRVPHSTDLLGCYVIEVDDDGDLVSYQRRRRYQRGAADGDDS